MAKKTGTLGPVEEETGKGSAWSQIYDLIGGRYLVIAVAFVIGVTILGIIAMTLVNNISTTGETPNPLVEGNLPDSNIPIANNSDETDNDEEVETNDPETENHEAETVSTDLPSFNRDSKYYSEVTLVSVSTKDTNNYEVVFRNDGEMERRSNGLKAYFDITFKHEGQTHTGHTTSLHGPFVIPPSSETTLEISILYADKYECSKYNKYPLPEKSLINGEITMVEII